MKLELAEWVLWELEAAPTGQYERVILERLFHLHLITAAFVYHYPITILLAVVIKPPFQPQNHLFLRFFEKVIADFAWKSGEMRLKKTFLI